MQLLEKTVSGAVQTSLCTSTSGARWAKFPKGHESSLILLITVSLPPKEKIEMWSSVTECVCHPDCVQLNLQYANSQGIEYTLSVPRVIGAAELLSLHQFDSVGRLDSTVKSPHSTQGYSQLLSSFHDGLRSLLVVTLRANLCMSEQEDYKAHCSQAPVQHHVRAYEQN